MVDDREKKDNKKIKDRASYKIGYAVGYMLFSPIRFIYWCINKLIENRFIFAILSIAVIYLTVLTVTGPLRSMHYLPLLFYISIFVIPVYAIIMVFRRLVGHSIKKKRGYFNSLFEEIGLETKDGATPYFLYEDESDYITTYSFNTLIPLKEWLSKKDILEMHMNVQIIDITQDNNDKRKINIIVQNESLAELIKWDNKYIFENDNTLSLGVSHDGFVIGIDLEQTPHTFIAGETGSGKSNILKCLIYQALYKNYDVVLIDFKRGVSFSSFCDVIEVLYEYKAVMEVLKSLVSETNNRLDKFRISKVDNLNDYNKIAGEYLHRRIVFIDELAELLKTRDKEVQNILYDSIETLTRLARAVGIHLIMGIQRPDSTIVSGQIKNNVSMRVCGRFVDPEPSRIMLGNDRASLLPNIKGRFIVKDDETNEIQAFYYSDTNIYNSEPVIEEEKGDNTSCNDKQDINAAIEPINSVQEEEKPKESSNISNEINFDFSDIKK